MFGLYVSGKSAVAARLSYFPLSSIMFVLEGC